MENNNTQQNRRDAQPVSSPTLPPPRYKASSWMYDLREHIGHFPFNFIRMPGTHNSGSDAICMNSGVAPDAPSILKKCDGTLLGHIARQVTVPWAKAQNLSLYEQLEHGVRFLDLRIGINPKYPLTTPPPPPQSAQLPFQHSSNNTAPSTHRHHHWGTSSTHHRRQDPSEVRRLASHHRNRLWLKHSLFSKPALEGFEEIKRFAMTYPREIIIVDCRSVDHFNHEDLKLLWDVLLRDTLLPYAIPTSLATMSDTLDHIWNIPTGNPVRNIFLLMNNKFKEWATLPENVDILAEFTEYGHMGTSLRNEWHNRTCVAKLLATMRTYDARIMGESIRRGREITINLSSGSPTSSTPPPSASLVPMSRGERNRCMSSCFPFVTGTVVTADTETIKSAICGGSGGGSRIPTSLEHIAALGSSDFMMYFWDMNMPGSEERARLVQMAQILLAREERRDQQQKHPSTGLVAHHSSNCGGSSSSSGAAQDTGIIPSVYCSCNPWKNFICQWCRCNLNANVFQLDFVQMGHINSKCLSRFNTPPNTMSKGSGGSGGVGIRVVYHQDSHVLNVLDLCIEINLRISQHPYALRYLKLKE